MVTELADAKKMQPKLTIKETEKLVGIIFPGEPSKAWHSGASNMMVKVDVRGKMWD